MQSLCGDLLQPKAGSAESTLVLNTLPWERTEVISRTGPAGTETLGMSNSRGDSCQNLFQGQRQRQLSKKYSASPWPGEGLLTCQIPPWDFTPLQVHPELWIKKKRRV